MKSENQAVRKLHRRDEAIFEANGILNQKASQIPPVSNVGRAAFVLGLHASKLDLDYRIYEAYWERLRANSSFTDCDGVPFTIIATEDQAFEIVFESRGFDVGEVLEAADKLWLGDPQSRVQLTTVGQPVVIDGKQYPPITAHQYAVIKTLLRSGRRMTEQELIKESEVPDARGVLKRLATMTHWKKVLIFPMGAHAGGYGIR